MATAHIAKGGFSVFLNRSTPQQLC